MDPENAAVNDSPIRVVVLCNDDPTSHVIFHRLFGQRSVAVLGVGFAASPTPKKGGTLSGAWALLRKITPSYWFFLAALNGAFRVFEMLTRISGGRAIGQRDGKGFVSLRQICREHDVPYQLIADFNGLALKQSLRALKPDLIVARVHTILDDEVLDAARYGVWVVHSSILPACQGIAGEFHAMRLGLPVGSSIFKAVPQLDEGTTFAQRELPPPLPERLGDAILLNNHRAAGLLLDCVIEKAHSGEVTPRLYYPPQEKCYFSWPTRTQVREFRQRGHKLLFGFPSYRPGKRK